MIKISARSSLTDLHQHHLVGLKAFTRMCNCHWRQDLSWGKNFSACFAQSEPGMLQSHYISYKDFGWVCIESWGVLAHNIMNLFFSVLTRNWLHRSQIGCHKRNSVAYLNRLEVTIENQWKEPATWAYSVTLQESHSTRPCWRSMLRLWALLVHTQKAF